MAREKGEEKKIFTQHRTIYITRSSIGFSIVLIIVFPLLLLLVSRVHVTTDNLLSPSNSWLFGELKF